MIMDKCFSAFCEYIQLLHRLSDDIEICQFLYNSRYLIILQVIGASLIFAGLAIATYKAYRGLLPS
jgi:hypothetical protein